MKHEAGKAWFLTLTIRKYGCLEIHQLKKNAVTPPKEKGRIIRGKTNGGIDSLVAYLQASLEKK